MYFKLFFLFSAHSVNVIEKHPNMRSIESTNKKKSYLGNCRCLLFSRYIGITYVFIGSYHDLICFCLIPCLVLIMFYFKLPIVTLPLIKNDFRITFVAQQSV